jgi:hypothetical protein
MWTAGRSWCEGDWSSGVLEYWSDEQPLVEQVAEKGSECFECLSMNGKSSMVSKPSVRPEPRRRTPTEVLSSLLVIPYSNTPLR